MLKPQIIQMQERYAAGYGFKTKLTAFEPRSASTYWTNCKFTSIPAEVYSAFAAGSPGEVGLFKTEKNKQGNLDYFYGSLVESFENVPDMADRVIIPGGEYAVFETEKLNMAREGTTAFVLDIMALWEEIFEEYLPASPWDFDASRPAYEFYGSNSAVNEDMSMNIFVPVKKK
ncbi:MAG: GyrI-like domain-containing protein [Eubacteriaceae bacterium]|nr:GyrI-like domain-containing protein [Eubacteriaceae bacterium]